MKKLLVLSLKIMKYKAWKWRRYQTHRATEEELQDLDRLGLSHNKFCDRTHLSESGSFKNKKVSSIDGTTHPPNHAAI